MIIEVLATGPKRTSDLVDLIPEIGRTGVLKHIEILKDGGLINIRREGRVRWNYLNSEPIESVCSNWVIKHSRGIKASAIKLKEIAEKESDA